MELSGPLWPKPEIEQYTSSGRIARSVALSRPYFAITPGEKFSTTTSARRTRSRISSREPGLARSIAMLRLPAFMRAK